MTSQVTNLVNKQAIVDLVVSLDVRRKKPNPDGQGTRLLAGWGPRSLICCASARSQYRGPRAHPCGDRLLLLYGALGDLSLW